ncbi:hypothetical protein SMITH_341 [Smithella sp. ME-1]|nr:hypothetical protein SMITH_341 [Smithella sp. ME-1]
MQPNQGINVLLLLMEKRRSIMMVLGQLLYSALTAGALPM